MTTMTHEAIRLHDRLWRLNNLYYIQDKKGRKIRFKVNRTQKDFFEAMHFLNIILKARQLGFTTFITIFMLDACLFNSNTQAGIIAHTKVDAEEIFSNKVKFAYDNLPDSVKAKVSKTQDRASKLALSNGSSLRVGTSMRGGTVQYLLISEHGKICARTPDKAKEIRTGALNAVEAGQFIFIESTAEGRDGDFFKFSELARKRMLSGKALSPLDFKFHFFPWWQNPEYALPADDIIVPAAMRKYVDELKAKHKIILNAKQIAWYVKKQEIQQDAMKQEYPSTPEDAFYVSVEGAYYSRQMTKARQEGRICHVPYEEALPVISFWDLGMNDATTIWFMQHVRKEIRWINFIHNSGESLAWYVKEIHKLPYHYAAHYLPHDVEVRELGAMDDETGKPRTRKQTLLNLGLKNITVVPRTRDILDDIEQVRAKFNSFWIDEENCAGGIVGLENYRKEWDEKQGRYRDRPLHNWASDYADPLRVYAKGYRDRAKRAQGVYQADTGFKVI